MILEYLRPQTMDEALTFLSRKTPPVYPLGGGTILSGKKDEDFAVMDLQNLALDGILPEEKFLELGSMVTLQTLFTCDENIPAALKKSLEFEETINVRQMATLGGTIVSADGRSAFLTSLLAMDVQLSWMPGLRTNSLGDYLALRSVTSNHGLLTSVRLPRFVELKIETIARTPADLPLLIIAMARWQGGRTRVAVGGFGAIPLLAMDGTETAGAGFAVRNALADSDDAWASSEYRSAAGISLARRMVADWLKE